jgi:hypothetical protein
MPDNCHHSTDLKSKLDNIAAEELFSSKHKIPPQQQTAGFSSGATRFDELEMDSAL